MWEGGGGGNTYTSTLLRLCMWCTKQFTIKHQVLLGYSGAADKEDNSGGI